MNEGWMEKTLIFKWPHWCSIARFWRFSNVRLFQLYGTDYSCFQIRFSFSMFELKALLLSSTMLSACKMANSDPVNAHGSTEICEKTKLVKELMIRITSLKQTVKYQEDTIRILNKNVDDLQNRMSAQEKYSSKDRLIFKNFPMNPFSKNLYNDVCKAIYHYFNYQITLDRIKTCHSLKNFKNGITPKIVKFIYFDDKDFIFTRPKMISDKLNGGKKLVIQEMLHTEMLELWTSTMKWG